MDTYVHCDTVYNSKDLEPNQMLTYDGLDTFASIFARPCVELASSSDSTIQFLESSRLLPSSYGSKTTPTVPGVYLNTFRGKVMVSSGNFIEKENNFTFLETPWISLVDIGLHVPEPVTVAGDGIC